MSVHCSSAQWVWKENEFHECWCVFVAVAVIQRVVVVYDVLCDCLCNVYGQLKKNFAHQ